jgi:hypothetical protein
MTPAARLVNPAAKAPPPATQSVLQRKCDCGNHVLGGAECTQCSKGHVSANSSAFEDEADRFAASAASSSGSSPTLSLGAARSLSNNPNPLLHATIQAGISTPSEPVPAATLARVAPGFTNTGAVNIHRNTLANDSARLAGAHAYTYGNHIVLGRDASDLNSPSGLKTFAHEFAHVGQQTGFSNATATPQPQFSMQTYINAMQQKPEPDWKTAAEHLNGEKPSDIKIVLSRLSPEYRVKLHEAARVWPGLCSNIGRFTEADYLKAHPETTTRVANTCSAPAAPTPAKGSMAPAPKPEAEPTTPEPTPVATGEITEKDIKTCSPLYLQKLCVHILGGFNGDRSGVETPEEMTGYNRNCRAESGYDGPDVTLSDEDKVALRSPKCPRGDAATAAARARAAKVNEALKRSVKYMPGGAGEEFIRMLTDPMFLGSLAVAIGVYLALWLAPEPVFTKIAAAATTIAILSTGAFAVSTLYNVAMAWTTLDTEAGNAQSDAELEKAAEKFGKRMGAVEAELIIFIASLLIGGKLPGPKRMPAPATALADAEVLLATTPKQGGVLIQGNFGRARIVSPPNEPPAAFSGSNPLKIEPAPMEAPLPAQPAKVYPFPVKPRPAPAQALGPATPATPPVTPVIPHVGALPGTSTAPKPKPPFVLRLPQQKAPHLETYRAWLGVLQSDPNYQRGNPGQLERWHQALRIGGSNAIPADVYERGHHLGFTGEAGERRVRVPDWSRTKSTPMEVDHIIELQVTPMSHRDYFNSIANFELLDRAANGSSGPLLANNIAAERAIQVAFDPSAAGKILTFDQVVLDGGSAGERWLVDEIRGGEQLDAYEGQL